jgi:hypothetical protein
MEKKINSMKLLMPGLIFVLLYVRRLVINTILTRLSVNTRNILPSTNVLTSLRSVNTFFFRKKYFSVLTDEELVLYK